MQQREVQSLAESAAATSHFSLSNMVCLHMCVLLTSIISTIWCKITLCGVRQNDLSEWKVVNN